MWPETPAATRSLLFGRYRAAPVVTPVGPGGCGSKLIRRMVSAQLGGTIERRWSLEGLVPTLRLDKKRLVH